jgi:hypothetical protein
MSSRLGGNGKWPLLCFKTDWLCSVVFRWRRCPHQPTTASTRTSARRRSREECYRLRPPRRSQPAAEARTPGLATGGRPRPRAVWKWERARATNRQDLVGTARDSDCACASWAPIGGSSCPGWAGLVGGSAGTPSPTRVSRHKVQKACCRCMYFKQRPRAVGIRTRQR